VNWTIAVWRAAPHLVAMKNKVQLANVLEYAVQGLYKYCTHQR
jgi:hypothetical protein